MNIYTACAIRNQGRFLLLYHNAVNRWVFPGGKPEPNESAVDCVRREVREELGIEVDDIRYVQSELHTIDGKEWLGVFFHAASFTGTPSIWEPEKHARMLWLTTDEMFLHRGVSLHEFDVAMNIESEGLF